MSRSYRKTLQFYPAHVKSSDIGNNSWKKTLRRKINACRDSDGTPILPHKINSGWPLSRGGGKKGSFGYGSYDQRVYQIRRLGGKLVRTDNPVDDYWNRRAAKWLRQYRNK